MAIIIDMSNCPCCVCCPYAYANLPSLHVQTVFDWNDGHYEPAFDISFDGGEQKWIGDSECNGQGFSLKAWCNSVANGFSANQWLFSLISGGIDYAVPYSGGPGGCTLLSCRPFLLFGEISIGNVYGDDFPFCDKGGTFPDGQYLNRFYFLASE